MRELELVQLLGQGLSNRQIAQELVISHNTVKVHLRNIYAKLGVSSRTEATMAAVRMGWIEVDTPGQESRTPAESITAVQAVDGDEASLPATDRDIPATQPMIPLALWQRVYLIGCALLVALGLWLTWPDRGERPGPFTDRPVLAESQSPSPAIRWRALAQMPTPRARLAVTAFQEQIYAIGGESRSGIVGIVEIYRPDTDNWRRGADLPFPVANIGAAVIGPAIYVPGGSTADGQTSDRLQVYEPGTNEPGAGTWTSTAARLPKGLSAYAIAAHQDILYLFGGWDGSLYTAEALKYDPQTDEWTSLAPMATPRAFAGAGTVGDHIYVVGGYDGQQELDTCEMYDPILNDWAACPRLNVPRGGIAVTVIADTLYVIGGGWQSYLVENEYLAVSVAQPDASSGAASVAAASDTPAEDTWSTFPSPLLQEWRNLGAASTGTLIYAIGGWNGGFVGSNQTYRTLFRLYVPNVPGSGPGN